MNIHGQITGIKYKICLAKDLRKIELNELDINKAPTACLVTNHENIFAISKWVSPKRTRSYPYERVYNTLKSAKKITIIPIVKDEGAVGDRDYLQWDTISLMSSLDVFVVFAYYDTAVKKGDKITNQQFNNEYIVSKIKEIEQYHSSALHWNLNEMIQNLHTILDKVKSAYTEIEKTTNVKLHNVQGIDNFKENIGRDVAEFMEFSREKAQKAQSREFVTIQPKESLATLTKAKITINNYLGGLYFFTVDEINFNNDKLQLIESKHSNTALLPSKSDIKDGLLKMILYTNLSNTKVNGKTVNCEPILLLTSSKLHGQITTHSTEIELDNFFKINTLKESQKQLIHDIINETKSNNFITIIKHSK